VTKKGRLQLGLLSAAMVRQQDDLIHQLLLELRDSGIARQVVLEIILQSYLHDGYATALEGVQTLRILWPAAGLPAEASYAEWEMWEARGRNLFEHIYGDVAERVETTVADASPDLAQLMITEGYGKVLARPGVDIITRELCTVAVLIMKQRPRQLFSHLRGALRVGVARDDIHELLVSIRANLGAEEAVTSAENLLATLT